MITAKANDHLIYACLGTFAMLLPTLVLVTGTTIMATNRRCKKWMGLGSVPWWTPLAFLPYPVWGLGKELAHLFMKTTQDKRGQIKKKLLLVLGAVDTAFENLPMVCEAQFIYCSC